MNRRALLIALLLAVMGATLLFVYVRRFEQEASGGEKVRLLATKKTIERGAVITEDALGVREVPVAYVEERAIKAADMSKVVGLRVGMTLAAQQTLMWSDLAVASDERRDLSSLVQPGNRAVSVLAATNDKSFALIHPGDYVDLISTMQPGKDPSDQARTAVVLLQRVLVLAVGLDTEPRVDREGNKQAQRDLILTVSVNLQEAQLLALATEKGRLSVALRNPDDPRVVEGIPDMPSTALVDTKARADVQKIRRSGPIKLGAEAK
jgi:pilus assembly protein CpaB